MTGAVRVSAFLLALLLAGCGGAEPTSEEGDVPTTDETLEGTTTTEEGGDVPESLADFFGFPTGDDPEAAQAQFQEQERAIQEKVRLCMAEQGFEYIPATPPAPDFASFETSEEEFVKKQGFGITTWYGNEEMFTGPEQDWVDPNQAIVDAMSESEREAYYEALYGPPDQGEPQVDPETGETFYVSEGFGPGCWGQASEEVYGNQDDIWAELGPDLETMWERIQADPRVAEANVDWSECMAGRGYEFSDQEDMYNSVFEDLQKRFDDIVGPGGGFGDPFAGWSEEEIEAFFAERTEQEVEAFFEENRQQTRRDIDEEALAALQQEEIDLAVANYECQVGMRELMEEISREYEAQFIREHLDTLERIRDAREG